MTESFKFYECVALTKMTGRKAADIMEFIEILKAISPESIFHHMHQYFLKPHIIAPEFPNDFAVWVAESLGERNLAEGLANLNPFEFVKIEDIRDELIRIMDEFLKSNPAPRPAVPGQEFFFNEGVTFVIPTGLEASSIEEFMKAIGDVHASSIYFHFYEARLRIGREQDDFSRYLGECLGCSGLSAKIKRLDPYMYSTEALRAKFVRLIQEEIYGHRRL